MKEVLQKLAQAPAVAETKVLIIISFLPVAPLIIGSVIFLRPAPTKIAEVTAAAYPPAISVLVYLHVLFLLPKFNPAL